MRTVAFLCLILSISPACSTSSRDSLRLTITPTTINAGDSVTVEWHVPTRGTAFINRVGPVSGDGQSRLKLLETSPIYMLMDREGGLELTTTDVHVTGGRGSFNVDATQYLNPVVVGEVKSRPAELVGTIYRTLQDAMQYRIQELQVSNSNLVLVTSSEDRPELIESAERQIGGRRVAYLLELRKKEEDPDFTLTIRAMITYRRLSESIWRTEEAGSPIYPKAIEPLVKRLATHNNKR